MVKERVPWKEITILNWYLSSHIASKCIIIITNGKSKKPSINLAKVFIFSPLWRLAEGNMSFNNLGSNSASFTTADEKKPSSPGSAPGFPARTMPTSAHEQEQGRLFTETLLEIRGKCILPKCTLTGQTGIFIWPNNIQQLKISEWTDLSNKVDESPKHKEPQQTAIIVYWVAFPDDVSSDMAQGWLPSQGGWPGPGLVGALQMLPACPLETCLHQALCPLSLEGPEHHSLGVGASGGDAQSRCLEKLPLGDSQHWGMTF